MTTRLIVKPTQEPVTLQEAKDWARITTNDFDTEISTHIKTAREEAEKYVQWVFMTQTWELSFDRFPCLPIESPRLPLQALESVKLVDENAAEVAVNISDFIVSTRSGKVYFKKDKSWPTITLQKFDSVIFTFKLGYPTAANIPETVKAAICLYVKQRIDNPEVEGFPPAFYNLLNSCLYIPPA